MKHDIGMIGLAVMGRSLALNMADHGFLVSGYNRNYEVTKHMEQTWTHENFTGYETLKQFMNSLVSPKKVMLMVKAGDSVDVVLQQLLPFLEAGDMVFDGGNSFFQDTIRREKELKERGIHYFGVGVSGGESGARFGPSIMPGGNMEAYKCVQTIFETISAKAKDGSPCCTYIGENGAGHYVKMVHNGIEYADMQIITEAYLILKYIGKLDNETLANVFQEYDQGELQSYLIHITASILKERDDISEGYLLDVIKDASSQKGTGKWTSEEALHQGVDVSMITSAYHARIVSSSSIRSLFKTKDCNTIIDDYDVTTLIQQVKEGMYAAKMVAYAQGFDLLKEAAITYNWKLDFAHIASIFRSGCIIQARFLDDITRAYQHNHQLPHLLMDDYFSNAIVSNTKSLREMVSKAILNELPVPAFASAISYLDMLKSHHVGANLIQAQRDCFGAHTFERIDQDGSYHHAWGKGE